MALFGKKSDEATPKAPKAPKTPKAPKAPKAAKAPKAPGAKKGLSFGKKGSAEAASPPVVPGDVDLSEFAELEAAAPATNGHKVSAPPRPAKTLKNGTIVGLNIGQHSIKAVEVTTKGGQLAITAAGEIPTPPESITNGVVTNTTALAGAIRELMKSAGMKSKQIVTSVSGTGSLVVRVIEVPRMGDKELEENMRQDAERYIPFPPSEVIMDFKALRELPSDPDAPNMEVLLAAAQREIVDAHVQVVDRAKLDPRSIDVEPLAAARAIAEIGVDKDQIDYFDVTAIINLGATTSEISVLRGDLLVFTRSLPKGGNDFTQTLVDHLALPWHDAERLKISMGDALPPQADTPATDSTDDWSDFGVMGDTAEGSDTPFDESSFEAGAFETGSPETGASHNATASNATSANASTAPTAPQLSDDPFDPSYFDQGPVNREPGEQHGQKENEPFNFDFSFGLSGEEDKDAADQPVAAQPPAQPAADAPSSTSDAAPATPAFDFSLDEPPAAPSAAPTAPQTTTPQSAPPQSTASPAAPAQTADADFSFDAADSSPPAADASAWQMSDDEPKPAPGASPATSPAGYNFSLDDEPSPAPTHASQPGDAPKASSAPTPTLNLPDFDTLVEPADVVEEGPSSATIESAYDLSEFGGLDTPGTPVTSAAPATPSPIAPPPPEEELDLDSLFGEPSTAPQDDFATFGAAPVAGAAAAGAVTGAASDDFGFGDFANFGAGLSESSDTPMVGIDAATVYSILAPQLEELVNEVRRSLEYHASRYPDAAVRRIVLIGGGTRMKNIDAYFTQQLGIPTTIGNPLARLPLRAPKLAPDFIDQNGPALAVALGLAVRDMV